jgi:signal transduction histidine kinase
MARGKKRTAAKSTPTAPARAPRSIRLPARPVASDLAVVALNAWPAAVALLDARGRILFGNQTWRSFAAAGQKRIGQDGAGETPFIPAAIRPLEEKSGREFWRGVKAVLAGRREAFLIEYAVSAGGQTHWFQGRVAGLERGGPVRAMIVHEEISARVALEHDVLQASAREQERLGQELHDGLSQQLTGLKFKAFLIESRLQSAHRPEAAEARLLSQLLNRAVVSASKLGRRGQPVDPEPDGLMLALRELAANTEQAHGVTCLWHGRPPVLLADPEVALEVYRIAEEAVAAAVSQSQARRIRISLRETGGEITLTVRHNGSGRLQQVPVDDLALRLMSYRARRIGGRIEVRPRTKSGMVLTCGFPRSDKS